MNKKKLTNFIYEKKERTVFLSINTSHERANILSKDVLMEFDKIVKELKNLKDISALVIMSKKPGMFIAGADVNDIKDIVSEDDALEKTTLVQDIFNSFEDLACTTLVVIDGACVGGGLELSLCADYIIASDNPAVKIGLPEIRLGIIPGFGGSYRLPKKVGLRASLTMLLQGTFLKARVAHTLGLVDKVISHTKIEDELQHFLSSIDLKKNKARGRNFRAIRMLEKIPAVRSIILNSAEKISAKRGGRHYPAIALLLQTLQQSFGKAREEALKIERAFFCKAVTSRVSKNLTELFLIDKRLSKETFGYEVKREKSLNFVTVCGSGTMGKDIAFLLAKKNLKTSVYTPNASRIEKVQKHIEKSVSYLRKRARLTASAAESLMARLNIDTNLDCASGSDIVIESIVESVADKEMLLTKLEAVVNSQSIVTTNTSSLLVTSLQDKLRHPERFAGFHFFNPAHRIPIVEIIPGKKTDPRTIALLLNFASKLGKKVLVVKDTPGFLINRILAPYLHKALELFEKGASITRVDRAMEEFGFALGPFSLMDSIGLDLLLRISSQLSSVIEDRVSTSQTLALVAGELGLKGKKEKAGFYLYKKNRKKLHPKVQSLFAAKDFDYYHIREQLLDTITEEAKLCLKEGIITDPSYLDYALILAAGFPAYTGGPLKYAGLR